jgi:hypothetical protein
MVVSYFSHTVETINLVNSGDLWAGDRLEREKEKRRKHNLFSPLFLHSAPETVKKQNNPAEVLGLN